MYSATLQFEARQKPVCPRDCGLAIAIPVDQNGFLNKLSREAEGNFAQSFGSGRQSLSPLGLWRLYEPYAQYTQKVAEMARQSGVSVVLGASLDDLKQQLATHEVVTLIAHWKGALFKPADIIDSRGIASALQSSQSKLAQALRQFSSLPAPAAVERDQASIVQFLNLCLVDGLAIPGTPDVEVRPGTITRFHYELHRRRQILESVADFRGGPSVELSAGFVSLEVAVGSVPKEFRGLIDLTVCNSVMLAESIRRARPKCSILANEDLAYLDFRLAVYAEVLRSLIHKTEPYEDVVYRIRKELKEAGNERIKGSTGALRWIGPALWGRSDRIHADSVAN